MGPVRPHPSSSSLPAGNSCRLRRDLPIGRSVHRGWCLPVTVRTAQHKALPLNHLQYFSRSRRRYGAVWHRPCFLRARWPHPRPVTAMASNEQPQEGIAPESDAAPAGMKAKAAPDRHDRRRTGDRRRHGRGLRRPDGRQEDGQGTAPPTRTAQAADGDGAGRRRWRRRGRARKAKAAREACTCSRTWSSIRPAAVAVASCCSRSPSRPVRPPSRPT